MPKSCKLNLFQQTMAFWEEVHPYNAGQVVHLRGRADVALLQAAVQAACQLSGVGRLVLDREKVHYHYEPVESVELRDDLARVVPPARLGELRLEGAVASAMPQVSAPAKRRFEGVYGGLYNWVIQTPRARRAVFGAWAQPAFSWISRASSRTPSRALQVIRIRFWSTSRAAVGRCFRCSSAAVSPESSSRLTSRPGCSPAAFLCANLCRSASARSSCAATRSTSRWMTRLPMPSSASTDSPPLPA